MASSVTPVQTRFNDPYDVEVFDYNTVDSKVYLSEESNKVLRAIGNNIVLEGLNIASIVTDGSPTITVNIAAGYAIQDDVLLIVSDALTALTIDVSSLTDTPVGGSYLAVFIDYAYIPSAETNTLALKLFHVDSASHESTGLFSIYRDKLLLGVISFTKAGLGCISAVELLVGNLVVEHTLFWVKGYDPTNINFKGLVDFAVTITTGLQDLREHFLRMDYLLSE